ncbi:MAG: division/cell wall cluster transcriptional repressor MraZ [Kiloniellales bacterium]|nr:division/cell wall cluster transcriptional repressor MraZ [Kiloniellales bacterium]
MALFIGTFENKVDRKGRVSVPAPFRQAIAGLTFNGIVAFPSHRAAAIEACGIDFMEQLNERMDHFDLFSDQHDDLALTIFAASHQLACDPEGRVILPPALLEHAGISDRAAFVGKGRVFQIWQPETLADQVTAARERARNNALTVPLTPADGGGR